MARTETPTATRAERRRRPRVAVHWAAVLRSLDGQRAWPCTAVNVSEDGATLQFESCTAEFALEEAGAGPVYRLELDAPGSTPLPVMAVEQVWAAPWGGKQTTGWRFVVGAGCTGRALLSAAGIGAADPVGAPAWDAGGGTADDEVDLWQYVKVLVRRRWVVVGSVLACTVLAALHAVLSPQLYEATALVLPVGEVDYLMRNEGLDYEAKMSQAYVTVLKSVPMKRSVVRRAYDVLVDGERRSLTLVDYMQAGQNGMRRPEDVPAAEWERQLELAAIGWVDGAVKVSQDRDTRVISIACSAPEPGLAADIANHYVAELRAHSVRSSEFRTRQNLTMAAARLDTLRGDLADAEQRLQEFRWRNQQLLRDSLQVALAYPEIATMHQRLQSEVLLKQSLYGTVANQHELLRLQTTSDAAGFEVLAEAEPPLASSGSLVKQAVLGMLAGGMVGLVLAFAWDYLDRKAAAGELEILSQAWKEDWGRLVGQGSLKRG